MCEGLSSAWLDRYWKTNQVRTLDFVRKRSRVSVQRKKNQKENKNENKKIREKKNQRKKRKNPKK